MTDDKFSVYLLQLTATDKDIDRPNNITYTLQGSSFNVEEFFVIGVLSGELYLLKPLDRDPPEGRPDYQFTVRAADENIDPNFGYASVNVRPQDINDNDPEFVTNPLEASVDEHSPLGKYHHCKHLVQNVASEQKCDSFLLSLYGYLHSSFCSSVYQG